MLAGPKTESAACAFPPFRDSQDQHANLAKKQKNNKKEKKITSTFKTKYIFKLFSVSSHPYFQFILKFLNVSHSNYFIRY